MRKLAVLCAAVIAAILAATAPGDATRVAFADTSTITFDVKFCPPESAVPGSAEACAATDVVDGGGPATGYDSVSYLQIDPAAGPGGAPAQPMLDALIGGWENTLLVNNAAATGAVVGELDLHVESNASAAVNPATGGVDACGDAPSGVDVTAALYAAVRGPVNNVPTLQITTQFSRGGRLVQAFDDDDGDLVEHFLGADADDPTTGLVETPETQEDGIDLNGDADYTDANEVRPNGIVDGAERMPHFLPKFFFVSGLSSLVDAGSSTRSYGTLDLAGAGSLDINVIVVDLSTIGVPAYVSATLFGVVDPHAVYPYQTASQALQTCAPMQSALATFGISRDNAATSIAGAETGPQCLNDLDDNADGAVNDGCPANTNAETGGQCLNSTDDDSDGVVNDGCPAGGAVAESGAQCTNAIDDDGDRGVNDGCPVASTPEGGAQCLNAIDDDFDAVVNDGCPAVAAAESGPACANALDDDLDTFVNDGCPAAGGGAEGGDSCLNAADDDGDGVANDGCPQLSAEPEDGFVCAATADNDSDTRINDGCPVDTTPETNLECILGDSDDDDGDFFVNDGCPEAGAPEVASQCFNNTDNDGDSLVNDGCPAKGLYEDGTLECANSADDDGDGLVNDGCDAQGMSEFAQACSGSADDDTDGLVNDGCVLLGAAESGAQCQTSNNADDDNDGLVNDGCPEVSGDEAAALLREVTGSFNYMMGASTAEDYDNDGVAAVIDRCNIDAAAGLDESDGDEVSGLCDNAPTATDNCSPLPPTPACPVNLLLAGWAAEASVGGTLCTTTTEAIGAEGGAYSTAYPWDLDQDVDCDGTANFADNCPVTYNPSQRDNDTDTAGNACDPAPAENACSGDDGPGGGVARWPACAIASQGHDHELSCNDAVDAAAGSPEANDAGAATVCVAALDSSDDGVFDFSAALFPGYAGHEDVNSDTDHDGCPDKDEIDDDASCGGSATSPPGNPLNADVDGDGVLDGAEDRDLNVIADWRDSVAGEPQTSAGLNDGGSPDSDGDGCSNRREALTTDASGGNRSAINPYDYPDVPSPADGGPGVDGKVTLSVRSARNRAIALIDVGVVLAYVGRTSTNAGAPYYNGDLNRDGIPDGRQMDRTPGPGNNEQAGNLAVALTDVGIILDHVGDSCSGTP